MARKLILLASLVAVGVLAGCSNQVGPNDKTVSGKDYKDIVNSTVPENERNQTNPVRDSAFAPGAKK